MFVDFSNAVLRSDLTSWMWVLIEASVFPVICIATRCIDLRGTLYVDFFLALVYIAGGLIVLGDGLHQPVAEGSDLDLADHYTSCLNTPLFYPFLVVIATFLGLHSSVVPLIFAACLVAVLRYGSMTDGLPTILLTAVFGCGSMTFEFAVASLFRELHTELECNQLLLDGATDGFGVVDSENCVLVTASPKMLETFGYRSVQGQRLDTLVDTADHGVLAKFFGSVAKGVHPAPVLLTCSSQCSQFDIRLV
eukprot:2223740-Amphidinium_carterae.1